MAALCPSCENADSSCALISSIFFESSIVTISHCVAVAKYRDEWTKHSRVDNASEVTGMFFVGFNHSVWNALWVLCPIGIVAVIVLLVFAICKRQYYFYFDPKDNIHQQLKDEKGDFNSHSGRYQDLAKLVITLSVGAIAFLVNTWVGQKPPVTVYVEKLTGVTPIVVGFFGAAIALCILFMTLQTVWYEQYCHSPNHNSYRAWKYALCNVFGWTGLVAFVLGVGWLAANLF